MAIVVVTTSPTTLDSGSSEFVTVTNTGTVDVTVARGSQSFVLRPAQGRVVYPEGVSVTASVVSGSGQVSTAAQAGRSSQVQQFAADPAFTGTYARKLRQLFSFPDTPRVAMASAPTLAWSTSNPITSSVQVAYNSTQVTMESGYPRDNVGFSFRENNINGASTAPGFAIAFDYYGSDFAFQLRSFDGTGGTFWLEVDGQLTSLATFSPSGITPGAGTIEYLRVTFGSTAQRRIRLYLSSVQYQGLRVTATDAVSPARSSRRRVLVYGDSFVGSHNSGADQNLMYTEIGRILGMEAAGAGIGGTGYSGVGSSPYDNATRLTTAAAWNPDAIVIFGTINNDATIATQASAAAVFSSFASSCPNAPIYVVGPPMMYTGTLPANRVTSSAAIKAAALAAFNVIGFSDPMTGTWYAPDGRTGGSGSRWITGTGHVGATVGDGPSDFFTGADGTHPAPPAGDYYLARRTCADLYAVVNGVV